MAEIKEVMMEETNEFEVRDELIKMRKKINSFDELVDFLKFIDRNCNTGYGTAPRSIAQACVAVAWYFAGTFGITGFQAGFVMWDFIRYWMKYDNKCGLRLIDWDDMLYPQYSDKFDKTIDADVWDALQKQAKQKIQDDTNNEHYKAHPDVVAHWKNIADGEVPFGYAVKED
jgi:hypothetical protein